MTYFDAVRDRFGSLPYMTDDQAKLLRSFVVDHDSENVLEIGFFHGKSSAYIAAILEDLGRGHLTTIDMKNAADRKPNIEAILEELELRHRVTSLFAHRSYTWELAKLIRSEPRPQFDLCYFDGGHMWDSTGFGFLLVDMLLKPGGIIVFDDLPWTVNDAMKSRSDWPRGWRACSEDERATPGVQLVFDLLVPHLGYVNRETMYKGRWGVAQKPVGGPKQEAASAGVVDRLKSVFGGR